jgi:hypothetical protein
MPYLVQNPHSILKYTTNCRFLVQNLHSKNTNCRTLYKTTHFRQMSNLSLLNSYTQYIQLTAEPYTKTLIQNSKTQSFYTQTNLVKTTNNIPYTKPSFKTQSITKCRFLVNNPQSKLKNRIYTTNRRTLYKNPIILYSN